MTKAKFPHVGPPPLKVPQRTYAAAGTILAQTITLGMQRAATDFPEWQYVRHKYINGFWHITIRPIEAKT